MNYLVTVLYLDLVRNVHLRLDGPDRAQDRGARQLDRRGRHGAGRCGDADHDPRTPHQWPLIIAGLVVGVVLGVPPARLTKMTAMPQLVAFFNGVGGGTVALIALAEFMETKGFSAFEHGESPTVHIVVASLFAAIIGSISFWGSIIAFGKLQEILPGRPIGLGKATAAGQPAAAGRGRRRRGGDRHSRAARQRRGAAVVDDRPAGRRGRAGPDGGAAHRRRRHAGGHLAAQRA